MGILDFPADRVTQAFLDTAVKIRAHPVIPDSQAIQDTLAIRVSVGLGHPDTQDSRVRAVAVHQVLQGLKSS